jgi:hypothetical protein
VPDWLADELGLEVLSFCAAVEPDPSATSGVSAKMPILFIESHPILVAGAS